MAKRQPRYEETYQQDYFAEDELPFETIHEENVVMQHAPWWAIAAAFHALLLLAIWGLVLAEPTQQQRRKFQAAVENPELPEPPVVTPQTILPEDREDKKVEEPTEDPRITKIAEDDHSEDPTNDPENHELRPNPNPNESNAESPYPQNGFNTNIGIGGNIGGGGGPSGNGGFTYRRPIGGGNRKHKSDKNVLMALYWLRDHQDSTTGAWSADMFKKQCGTSNEQFKRSGSCSNRNGGEDRGWKMATDGVTGLALLAYLGAGFTQDTGVFKVTVKKALRYILTIQDDDGCFGPKEFEKYVYNHAICAMAVAEVYGMTGAAKLKGPAQRAVDFIALAQNNDPETGFTGWRYGVQYGESDTSVTGWMVLALKSAKVAGLSVPGRCFEGAGRFFDDMTKIVNGYPKTGYFTSGGFNARLEECAHFLPNPSMDSIAIFSKLFMGVPRNNAGLKTQSSKIVEPGNLPTTDDEAKIDHYYWYYASLAMCHMGGNFWKKWEEPMLKALLEGETGQRLDDKDACVFGSWDPVGAWGTAGGRVYSTAINCLTLESAYRYELLGANK